MPRCRLKIQIKSSFCPMRVRLSGLFFSFVIECSCEVDSFARSQTTFDKESFCWKKSGRGTARRPRRRQDQRARSVALEWAVRAFSHCPRFVASSVNVFQVFPPEKWAAARRKQERIDLVWVPLGGPPRHPASLQWAPRSSFSPKLPIKHLRSDIQGSRGGHGQGGHAW